MLHHPAKLSLSLVCVAAVFSLTSCSSGPQPPQPGTSAYEWAAAKETFRQGDYAKTGDHLAAVFKSDNELTAKAYPWYLILNSGMAQGYSDFADNQEAGAKATRSNPTPFRKRTSTARAAGAAASMQFVEAFHKFLATNKDATLALAFEYPAGTAAEPSSMEKIAKGMPLQDSELESTQKALLQRGVQLSLCKVLGTGNDSAKALEIFKKGDVTVPRDAFLLAMASSLSEQAELFGPKKLDQPNRIKMLSGEAMEALKLVPESKQTKELSTKIQANLKKLKLT